MPIYQLPNHDLIFPHPLEADPSGMLAVGGDLSPERLILAYQHGIFPWYNEGEPILWWFPNPRCVLFPEKIYISKSMRPYFNQEKYRVSYDNHFTKVIKQCKSVPREGQGGTWISEDMSQAYISLHALGIAHSVEVWDREDQLIGGLYGISIGKIFFGESMFALKSNASKFALISLAQKLADEKYTLIDCQQDTPHMKSMGAELISSTIFYQYCKENLTRDTRAGKWY
jgi:leucyl/phenylalanyl-tRNA--protein transferase